MSSFASSAEAGVFVEIFENYEDMGSSISFSNPVGTFQAPAIDFVIETGASWHPFGLSSFGARITGNLYMDFTGFRQVGITSSDGSYLFVNGVPLIQNGGIHDLVNVASTSQFFVENDPNPFEIQFFNAPGGGPSGIDFGRYFQHGPFIAFTPSFFQPVPEPDTLMAIPAALLLVNRRKLKKLS